MGDLISKSALLEYLDSMHDDSEWLVSQYNADWIYSWLESQPTIDAVEVKHGRWDDDCRCTNCTWYAPFDCEGVIFYSLYCPNCGTKMDGERKENG